MKTESEYTKQADDFLKKHGIKFRATRTKINKCPTWDDDKHIHGDRYRITFSRPGKQFSLFFWNSFNDVQTGADPGAYDVLAAIEKYDPEDFGNFCGNYGYSEDSIKALRTYKAVKLQYVRAAAFFTASELEEAQEIN